MSKQLRPIYTLAFLFSFHVALTAYINSTFIEQFVGAQGVGVAYALSSLMALFGLGILPKLIGRFGNVSVFQKLLAMNVGALLVMVLGTHGALVVPAALLYIATNTLLFFCLDIFVEHYSHDATTGKTRGWYLAITNLGWVLAPLIAGIIAAQGITGPYLLGALLVSIVGIISLHTFKHYSDVPYQRKNLRESITTVLRNKKLRILVGNNFLLQFFYAWMVIYSPIVLREYFELPLETIGLLFTFMLVPFVLFQLPTGKLIDKGVAEWKFITAGFLIMAGSVMVFGVLSPGVSISILALVLFLTRTGASIVEAANDVYFFKQLDDREAHLLSLYRYMTPLAYVIAPLIASIILMVTNTFFLFSILTIILIIGALHALISHYHASTH